MRKIIVRASIAVLTFTIGFSMVWIFRELAATPLNSVLVDEAKTYLVGYEKPRFSPIGRGCGMGGYSQTYATDDEQWLAEGVRWNSSPKHIRQEVLKRIRNAKEIIERIPNYPDGRGKTVERIVIVHRANEGGKESVTILWYDGGNSYRFINAPTKDLALEFERFLISIDFKSLC